MEAIDLESYRAEAKTQMILYVTQKVAGKLKGSIKSYEDFETGTKQNKNHSNVGDSEHEAT